MISFIISLIISLATTGTPAPAPTSSTPPTEESGAKQTKPAPKAPGTEMSTMGGTGTWSEASGG